MKKLRNKRIVKMKVKDLKEQLKNCDDEDEVVLGFYLKDRPNHFTYLAKVSEIKYDGVIKERLYNTKVVELMGFDHDYSTYVEKRQ